MTDITLLDNIKYNAIDKTAIDSLSVTQNAIAAHVAPAYDISIYNLTLHKIPVYLETQVVFKTTTCNKYSETLFF